MQDDVEGERHFVIGDAEQHLREVEVRRGRDGDELRQALNDAQDERVGERQNGAQFIRSAGMTVESLAVTSPQVSRRARLMPASPIRRLMPLAEEARRRGTRMVWELQRLLLM